MSNLNPYNSHTLTYMHKACVFIWDTLPKTFNIHNSVNHVLAETTFHCNSLRFQTRSWRKRTCSSRRETSETLHYATNLHRRKASIYIPPQFGFELSFLVCDFRRESLRERGLQWEYYLWPIILNGDWWSRSQSTEGDVTSKQVSGVTQESMPQRQSQYAVFFHGLILVPASRFLPWFLSIVDYKI